jgi:D-serine deaminase-like pyridoxal phosphate-dependent protein
MITAPTLLVDEKKCRANIRKMASKAKKNKVVFRPHFKTHQSHEIGNWFRQEGVSKITASSLSMASYFAEDGWDDITVAFPVNVLEMKTINRLASGITLNLLVESVEAVKILAKGVKSNVNLLIKLDIGTHRTGIDPKDVKKLHAVIAAIEAAPKLHFTGFLCHAGHSYKCRGSHEIMDVHKKSMNLLIEVRHNFPNVFISYGDTPTCSIADSFSLVNELRPGNFVFYDAMQLQIGSCKAEEISVALACPVVAKHPERNEVVIYGGGVHFSKDVMEADGHPVYGYVVADKGKKWEGILAETYVSKLSQEHGIIRAPKNWIEELKIGDVIKVLPVHSCMTMDLLREFLIV